MNRLSMRIEKPEQIGEEFVAAWNRYDAQKLAQLFSENANFVNVTGLWWRNREAIYRAHEYGLRVIFGSSTLQIKKQTVDYLTDEIAVVHTKIALTEQTSFREQETPQERQTIFTFVVQKIENSWICVAAQNTEIQKGMETFVAKKDGTLEAVNYRKKE